MKYNEINYLTKLTMLQGVYSTSSALAEVLGISRTSLVNWKGNPDTIRPDNRFNIDVLYCKNFVVTQWDNSKKTNRETLLPDNILNNQHVFMPFLRRLSYGTIEIETGISKDDFDRAIDAKKLPKNMTVDVFYEAFNTFVTLKGIWKRIVENGDAFNVTEDSVKSLHDGFMRGLRDDAGLYAKKTRVMGHLEGFQTTWPEDIPEVTNNWVYKNKNAATIKDIATAHADFIAIHPFGDGNGRVGRALVMAQCLNAGLMPPVFNSTNRAMYYASMEHAMVNGRYKPLIQLFHDASGYISNRLHALVFTPREDTFRVISLRKANRREVKQYEQRQAS